MWNWLAVLLVAIPITFSLNPHYREENPELLNFCLQNPDDGFIMEEIADRVFVEIPCYIWLSPRAVEKYLDECLNRSGTRVGYCVHMEI